MAAGVFLLAPMVSARTYADPGHRFSFHVPAGATVEDFSSTPGGIETLQISRSPSVATQITISLWPATTTLTKEALLHSYPSLASESTMPSAVGGADGIEFKDSVNGDENVWFAHGGYLFVAVGEGSDPTLLSTIIQSWKFF